MGETRTQAIETQAWIEADGELHLEGLPYMKGDKVEVILLIKDRPTDEQRQKASKPFNERADRMAFRSTGSYPTGDELH